MADYITITDSAIDPDAPLTSELAYAWRDNCVAIAEGAVGAPRVDGLAFGKVHLGLIARSDTTPVGFNNIGTFETLMSRGRE